MSKIKGLFYKLAPIAATLIGGPAAGLIVGKITGVLGLPENASEEEIEVALGNATPAVQAQIKQLDNDYKLELAKNGIKIKELNIQDRASAREREAKVGSFMTRSLAILIIMGFLGACIAVFTGYVADNMYVGIVLGVLGSKADAIVSYYFGSSHGSKMKTEGLLKK